VSADDVRDRLFERRVIMASGRLDAALTDSVAPQLLSLDAVGDEPIELVLDCPDAELDPAFTLLDMCELVSAPMTIVVAGRLTGAGIAVLTTRHRRVGRPHATLQLSQPRFEPSKGTADQIARLADHFAARIGVLIERVSDRTTRPAPLVADDMGRGVFLTSDQALAYGLLDDVLRRPTR
jgi:ATP-dependent Clp protease, protease subunit